MYIVHYRALNDVYTVVFSKEMYNWNYTSQYAVQYTISFGKEIYTLHYIALFKLYSTACCVVHNCPQ